MKAEAAAGAASALAQPVIWTILGYQFEAASMIAGLGACLMVRIWVSLNDKTARAWAVDMVVTGIALLFTAGWIVMQRPEPFYALMTGTGFGALGAGIIAIALKWVKRVDALVGLSDEETPPPPARPETATAIKDALRQLHDVPLPDEQPKQLPPP